jgi:ribosomal protein L11 methyltransferase
MALSSGRHMGKTWCWRRLIDNGRQDFWIAQLQAVGCASWVFTERPPRTRVLLEVYAGSRASVVALGRQFGGRVRSIDAKAWIKPHSSAPTRIGRKLEIIHDETRGKKNKEVPSLRIPHGIAFGSGEHATTSMLLRALTGWREWTETKVLDLGTGSGVLALTARLLGAKKILATDFDAGAVRTARQNEALNFSTPLVRWRCADVKKLRATTRYDLVLANLFSGILVEAAPQITGSVSVGGQLWLSGILLSQKDEVIAAYLAQGAQLLRAARRGKWVMLQFRD